MPLQSPTRWFWLAVNALPLVFVQTGNWDVGTLWLAYWWEGVLITSVALLKRGLVHARENQAVEVELATWDIPATAHVLWAVVLSLGSLWLISSMVLAWTGGAVALSFLTDATWARHVRWFTETSTDPGLLTFGLMNVSLLIIGVAGELNQRRGFIVSHDIFRASLIHASVVELAVFLMLVVHVSLGWFALWAVVLGKILVDGLMLSIERMPGNQPSAPKDYEP